MNEFGSFDESLFAWAVPDGAELRCYRKYKSIPGTASPVESIPKFELQRSSWGLLAPSPDCFRATRDLVVLRDKIVPRFGGGFQRTYQGVYVALPLGLTKSRLTGTRRKQIGLVLNCWRLDDQHNPTPVVIELSRAKDGMFTRTQCEQLESKKGATINSNRVLGVDQGQAVTEAITISQPQTELIFPR